MTIDVDQETREALVLKISDGPDDELFKNLELEAKLWQLRKSSTSTTDSDQQRAAQLVIAIYKQLKLSG